VVDPWTATAVVGGVKESMQRSRKNFIRICDVLIGPVALFVQPSTKSMITLNTTTTKIKYKQTSCDTVLIGTSRE